MTWQMRFLAVQHGTSLRAGAGSAVLALCAACALEVAPRGMMERPDLVTAPRPPSVAA